MQSGILILVDDANEILTSGKVGAKYFRLCGCYVARGPQCPLLHRSPPVTGATGLWNIIDLENPVKFADECQRRALLLMEIAREAPDFEAQALFVAEQWLYWARSRR